MPAEGPALTWRNNLTLETIVTGLSPRVTKPGTQFVAVGSTVAMVFGQKIEGAEHGYNPQNSRYRSKSIPRQHGYFRTGTKYPL